MDSVSGQQSSGPKGHKALKVVLGVVAIFVFLAVVGSLLGDKSGTPGASTPSSSGTSASSSAAAATSATPGLNQAARDGKFQFTVTSFACGQSQLSNDNEFETATAQGQFCVLRLDIKNIGSEAQQLDNSAQYVYTSDGKQLSYANDGTTAANSSGSQCDLLPTRAFRNRARTVKFALLGIQPT